MPKAVNNDASRRATTTTLLIAMPHMFVMRYRPNFRGDGITGYVLSVVFRHQHRDVNGCNYRCNDNGINVCCRYSSSRISRAAAAAVIEQQICVSS